MGLRKVLFKKWIPIEWGKSDNWNKPRVEGTGCWENEFINEGLFHQWGNGYEEFESGPGNYSVALVELPNGEMIEVLPTNLKFINNENN